MRQKALVVAYAVSEAGVREVIGIDVGEAETEAFWTEFLFSLKARGLSGVRLCVSDAHQGLRAAIARVLGCGWQRCTVHFLRNMLGHCARQIQPMVATAIRQIFRAEHASRAREHLVEVVNRLTTPAPKVARLFEDVAEVLAYYQFPADHWPKLRSTNPLERVNKEIGRRSDVVGIYPNDDQALIRLAGMVLLEQNGWCNAVTSPSTPCASYACLPVQKKLDLIKTPRR